jgi:hypothetical protein
MIPSATCLQNSRRTGNVPILRGSKAYVGIRGSYVLVHRESAFIKVAVRVHKPHSVDDEVFVFPYPPGQRKAVVVSPLESLNRADEVYNPERFVPDAVPDGVLNVNDLLARAAASREHEDADRVELVELRQDLGENRSPLEKEETL